MATAAFRITVDHLVDGDEAEWVPGGERDRSRAGWSWQADRGWIGPPDSETIPMPLEFRLYDDDGELYYSGVATGEKGAECALDWARGDAGATRVDVRGEKGWTVLIG